MANNPIPINELLDEMEINLKQSIDERMIGVPDSLDDAIDAAQTARILANQKKAPAQDVYMERHNWLKETEHNRLIALTEANRLAVEVFKSTVQPGGLVETTEEIIKSAAMIAAFLNEGKIK